MDDGVKLDPIGDLNLGRLTAAAPNNIATYPILYKDIDPDNPVSWNVYAGDFLVFGIAGSGPGHQFNPAGQKIGGNHAHWNQFYLAQKGYQYWMEFPADPASWALPRRYDSGAPAFDLSIPALKSSSPH